MVAEERMHLRRVVAEVRTGVDDDADEVELDLDGGGETSIKLIIVDSMRYDYR